MPCEVTRAGPGEGPGCDWASDWGPGGCWRHFDVCLVLIGLRSTSRGRGSSSLCFCFLFFSHALRACVVCHVERWRAVIRSLWRTGHVIDGVCEGPQGLTSKLGIYIKVYAINISTLPNQWDSTEKNRRRSYKILSQAALVFASPVGTCLL